MITNKVTLSCSLSIRGHHIWRHDNGRRHVWKPFVGVDRWMVNGWMVAVHRFGRQPVRIQPKISSLFQRVSPASKPQWRIRSELRDPDQIQVGSGHLQKIRYKWLISLESLQLSTTQCVTFLSVCKLNCRTKLLFWSWVKRSTILNRWPVPIMDCRFRLMVKKL